MRIGAAALAFIRWLQQEWFNYLITFSSIYRDFKLKYCCNWTEFGFGKRSVAHSKAVVDVDCANHHLLPLVVNGMSYQTISLHFCRLTLCSRWCVAVYWWTFGFLGAVCGEFESSFRCQSTAALLTFVSALLHMQQRKSHSGRQWRFPNDCQYVITAMEKPIRSIIWCFIKRARPLLQSNKPVRILALSSQDCRRN